MKSAKQNLAAVLAVAAVGVSGCASEWDGLNTWQPKTDPMRPTTAYTSALACIKGLIHDKGATGPAGKPITLTVGFMPDTTGKLLPGMRDMVTSAASDIAGGSRVFELTEIGSYGRVVGPTFGSKPDTTGSLLGIAGVSQKAGYQLVGALTQADSKNLDRTVSAGLSYKGDVNGGVSAGNTVSTVAIDLRLVDVGRSLSVAYTTRSLLRVKTSGFAVDVTFRVGDFGGDFSYDETKAEGPHQAVRELVELSVAELLGQAANVPYWACFGPNQNDPQMRATIQGWWSRMGEEETYADMQARLQAAGYPVPAAPRAIGPAILQYQKDNGLILTAKPTYETFASLVMRQIPKGQAVDTMPPPTSQVAPADQPVEPAAPK